MKWFAAALLALGAATAHAQENCGGPETPCEISAGTYHIVLPEGPGPHPVMVFLHGAGGKGAALVGSGGTSGTAVSRGYAYIAPNGLIRPGRMRSGWSFHPFFVKRRDERAFIRDVLADATKRFNLDPKRTILAGFSIGGSLASYIACDHPSDFSAYAPVAGNLWRPHPEHCAGPVRLLHTHGWRDKTVPLEGRILRQIGDKTLAQGDVFHAMLIWRTVNGCANYRADQFDTKGLFWRRIWNKCFPSTALELALFDGGHGVPPGWADMVLDWFEGLDANAD